MEYNIFKKIDNNDASDIDYADFSNKILREKVNLQFDKYIKDIDHVNIYGINYHSVTNPLEYYIIDYIIRNQKDGQRFGIKLDLIKYLIVIGFMVDITSILKLITDSTISNKDEMDYKYIKTNIKLISERILNYDWYNDDYEH
jgi:hypothetical protein